MRKYTPENIVNLNENEIFVFGSNEAGIHGAGAARIAFLKFGAEMGLGNGLSGNSYAIPTKDRNVRTLPLDKVKSYIDEFIGFVLKHQNLTFYLTKIGCGLAGFTIEEIKNIFWEVIEEYRTESSKEQYLPSNLIIPKEFDLNQIREKRYKMGFDPAYGEDYSVEAVHVITDFELKEVNITKK